MYSVNFLYSQTHASSGFKHSLKGILISLFINHHKNICKGHIIFPIFIDVVLNASNGDFIAFPQKLDMSVSQILRLNVFAEMISF